MTKTATIKLKLVNVYGIIKIYPTTYIDELRALTGKKTLDQKDLGALLNLGLRLENDNTEQIISLADYIQ